MATEAQRVYNRNVRRLWNDKRQPKPVEIRDPKVWKPYFITMAEYKLHARIYKNMGVRVFVDGEEVV